MRNEISRTYGGSPLKLPISLFKALLPVMVFFVLLLSCSSSPDVYAEIDMGVQTKSYETAISSMNNRKSRARREVYTPKNEILLYLDRGMIQHYAGLYEESSRDLELAELMIEEAFTKSISQEIGSFLVNDNVKDYSGEDYEDLYINVFNALNYYHRDNLEGALVEIRRLNEKLVYLADKYERASDKVLQSNRQINTGELPMEATRFSNSALARYMGILFYRATNRMDSARIDYEELKRAFDLAPEVYYHPIPSSIEDELAAPQIAADEGKARLNIIAFTGLSPIKEEFNILIPLPFPFPNNSARIALPKMVTRPQTILRAEAVLGTGERIRLELLEDMGAVARETFKAKYGLTVLKSTARAITKAAASAAVSRGVSGASSNRGGNDGLGALIGLLGRIYSEASEQADKRLSRYFPCYALVGGIYLDPGRHTVTVNYYGSGGMVYSERREIRVSLRSLNLMEFVCLR